MELAFTSTTSLGSADWMQKQWLTWLRPGKMSCLKENALELQVFLNGKRKVTVWHAQPWPPRISFIQVFDRFLTSLMDRMVHHIFCPPDLCLLLGDVIGSSEINSHRTCQKPVKKLYKTYVGGHGWTLKTVTK